MRDHNAHPEAERRTQVKAEVLFDRAGIHEHDAAQVLADQRELILDAGHHQPRSADVVAVYALPLPDSAEVEAADRSNAAGEESLKHGRVAEDVAGAGFEAQDALAVEQVGLDRVVELPVEDEAAEGVVSAKHARLLVVEREAVSFRGDVRVVSTIQRQPHADGRQYAGAFDVPDVGGGEGVDAADVDVFDAHRDSSDERPQPRGLRGKGYLEAKAVFLVVAAVVVRVEEAPAHPHAAIEEGGVDVVDAEAAVLGAGFEPHAERLAGALEGLEAEQLGQRFGKIRPGKVPLLDDDRAHEAAAAGQADAEDDAAGPLFLFDLDGDVSISRLSGGGREGDLGASKEPRIADILLHVADLGHVDELFGIEIHCAAGDAPLGAEVALDVDFTDPQGLALGDAEDDGHFGAFGGVNRLWQDSRGNVSDGSVGVYDCLRGFR